jgi:23S rRNA (uracil1939-C5)-methyltransferase
MKKNDIFELEITGTDADGFGIGKPDGFAVFVGGALPGDRILARALKVKPRYAYGKIEKIITPSPYRKSADDANICPHHTRCGGCQWQHCNYDAQLLFKKNIVTDALTRIGQIENPNVLDVIGMQAPYRYRGKAVSPIGLDGVGVFAARSHRIIPIADCNIQQQGHKEFIRVINEYIKEFNVPVYDEVTHTGLLRHLMVRKSFHSNEVMVCVTVNGTELPHSEELCARLTEAGASTVLISIHTKKGNAVLGDRFKILTGPGFITERIGGVDYQLSARSFFQVNPVQTKVLYDKAVEAADLATGDAVINAQGGAGAFQPIDPHPQRGAIIDAHAGVGGVALYAARAVRKVCGVEIVPEAVEDAKRNAALNGIDNAEFYLGAAETVIPELLNGGERFGAVFLDPPRKGCGAELLSAIVEAEIPKVVYISCDPATLARDIKIMADGGYMLKSAQPVDMFPQTGEVECVCLLTR